MSFTRADLKGASLDNAGFIDNKLSGLGNIVAKTLEPRHFLPFFCVDKLHLSPAFLNIAIIGHQLVNAD